MRIINTLKSFNQIAVTKWQDIPIIKNSEKILIELREWLPGIVGAVGVVFFIIALLKYKAAEEKQDRDTYKKRAIGILIATAIALSASVIISVITAYTK